MEMNKESKLEKLIGKVDFNPIVTKVTDTLIAYRNHIDETDKSFLFNNLVMENYNVKDICYTRYKNKMRSVRINLNNSL